LPKTKKLDLLNVSGTFTCPFDVAVERFCKHLIRTQNQNSFTICLGERNILGSSKVITPNVVIDASTIGLGNLDRVIGRSSVNEDDFIDDTTDAIETARL
jgi:hypothetical protein